MTYHTYKTKAFVLGSKPSGENNSFVYLFTEEVGLVGVIAVGIKKGTSKLRFSLQNYAKTQVSLVYGKYGWRLTNAENEENLYYTFCNEPEKSVLVARLFSLIKLLVGGEEKNETLFSIVDEGIGALRRNEAVEAVELVTVLRVLHNLGYVSERESGLEQYLMDIPAYIDIVKNKKRLIIAINNGLQAHEV